MKRAAFVVMVGCGAATGLGGVIVEDGGAPHADAGFDAGTVGCGDAACNANTQFCKSAGGGPPPGFHDEQCVAFEAGCHACACASPGPSQGCTCEADAGRVSVSCAVP